MLVKTNPVIIVTNVLTKKTVTLTPTSNTESSISRLIKSAKRDIDIVNNRRSGRVWPRFSKVFAGVDNSNIKYNVQYDVL
jgi:hypothetical protein